MKSCLGITMGDPLGIGPEIILKALPKYRSQIDFKVFGDSRLLAGLPPEELVKITQLPSRPAPSTKEAGVAAVAYLEAAMDAHARGEIKGLVTAPISKAHVQLAGFPFPGHTEYLAAKTGTQNFTMMMAGDKLRVSLVTIHQPLKEISSSITLTNVFETIKITHQSLKSLFGIPKPRVAVCALNPHAGEGGLLGTEEKEVIAPAIAAAREKGYACEGPRVPDAVFYEAFRGQWDAVVCMYHDQGLIPFKMIHFQDGVNLTLGLPLVRTSPDHGTAFDIAGKGLAESTSMESAIELAIDLVKRKK